MSCTSIDCSRASSARRACFVVHVPRPSVSTSQNLLRSVIRPYGKFHRYRAAPAKSSTPALRNRRVTGPSLDSAFGERPTSSSSMTHSSHRQGYADPILLHVSFHRRQSYLPRRDHCEFDVFLEPIIRHQACEPPAEVALELSCPTAQHVSHL